MAEKHRRVAEQTHVELQGVFEAFAGIVQAERHFPAAVKYHGERVVAVVLEVKLDNLSCLWLLWLQP